MNTVKVELTISQCDSLAELIEEHLLEGNPEDFCYVADMVDAYHVLKKAGKSLENERPIAPNCE